VHLPGVCSWTIVFRFKPINEKYAFVELTSFKTLFLVKFQPYTLVERNLLFVKCSCKTACENIDADPFSPHEVRKWLFICNICVRRKFSWGISISGVWCHCIWYALFVTSWRHIHVFQTTVLATFALISYSRQNKDNCFGYSELSRNTILNMRGGWKVWKTWWDGFWMQTIIQVPTKT